MSPTAKYSIGQGKIFRHTHHVQDVRETPPKCCTTLQTSPLPVKIAAHRWSLSWSLSSVIRTSHQPRQNKSWTKKARGLLYSATFNPVPKHGREKFWNTQVGRRHVVSWEPDCWQTRREILGNGKEVQPRVDFDFYVSVTQLKSHPPPPPPDKKILSTHVPCILL